MEECWLWALMKKVQLIYLFGLKSFGRPIALILLVFLFMRDRRAASIIYYLLRSNPILLLQHCHEPAKSILSKPWRRKHLIEHSYLFIIYDSFILPLNKHKYKNSTAISYFSIFSFFTDTTTGFNISQKDHKFFSCLELLKHSCFNSDTSFDNGEIEWTSQSLQGKST